MTILGKLNSNNKNLNEYQWYFTIETDVYCRNNTRLIFESDENYSFMYIFESYDELLEQFKKQETNLFKLFFNEDTINKESIEFDITPFELEESNINFKYDYPHFYELDEYNINMYMEGFEDILKWNKQDKTYNTYYILQDLYDLVNGSLTEILADNTAVNISLDKISLNDLVGMLENDKESKLLKAYNDTSNKYMQFAQTCIDEKIQVI